MRFQINRQKLVSLLLASCAITASFQSISAAEGAEGGALSHIVEAQRPVSIRIVSPPNFGSVVTASGKQTAGHSSSRAGSPSAAFVVAQPPTNLPQVPLPAAKGPVELTNQAASSSDMNASQDGKGKDDDGTDSGNSFTPIQNPDLPTKVHVVDTSVSGLGTGTIPDAAFDKRQAEAASARFAVQKCVHWHPSSICHYPLRFEETMLERHGHVRAGCLQPLVSGVRFFTTIPMLPYLNTLKPCYEPVYALGNYRPGSCAPLLRETIPYDKNAVVVEALAVAGFFWAMPL